MYISMSVPKLVDYCFNLEETKPISYLGYQDLQHLCGNTKYLHQLQSTVCPNARYIFTDHQTIQLLRTGQFLTMFAIKGIAANDGCGRCTHTSAQNHILH